eukprot:SAG11_NODE_1582_length_4646_cov_3.855949_6_plen_96_part_00
MQAARSAQPAKLDVAVTRATRRHAMILGRTTMAIAVFFTPVSYHSGGWLIITPATESNRRSADVSAANSTKDHAPTQMAAAAPPTTSQQRRRRGK